MVKTRNTPGNEIFCLPIGTDLPMSVKKILYDGDGGRLRPPTPPTEPGSHTFPLSRELHCPPSPTNEEVTESNQDAQEEPLSPEPSVLPPSQAGPPEKMLDDMRMILVSHHELKTMIEENIVCKRCIYLRQLRFNKFCTTAKINIPPS